MNFWHHVETSSGMGRHYPWVLLGCIVIAMLLVLIAPHARRRLRAAVLLIGLSFAAMLVCGLLTYSGTLGPTTAGFRYIHFGSQLLFSLAIINILGVLVFRLVLAPVRLEPAPILRDTLLGLSASSVLNSTSPADEATNMPRKTNVIACR